MFIGILALTTLYSKCADADIEQARILHEARLRELEQAELKREKLEADLKELQDQKISLMSRFRQARGHQV